MNEGDIVEYSDLSQWEPARILEIINVVPRMTTIYKIRFLKDDKIQYTTRQSLRPVPQETK